MQQWITREGCKLVLNEVFEGDIHGFIDRGDRFSAMMPSPDSERELSEHSPLYESEDVGTAEARPNNALELIARTK